MAPNTKKERKNQEMKSSRRHLLQTITFFSANFHQCIDFIPARNFVLISPTYFLKNSIDIYYLSRMGKKAKARGKIEEEKNPPSINSSPNTLLKKLHRRHFYRWRDRQFLPHPLLATFSLKHYYHYFHH